ncbi:hypothetical protein, partial [Methylobacterium sp. D48H]
PSPLLAHHQEPLIQNYAGRRFRLEPRSYREIQPRPYREIQLRQPSPLLAHHQTRPNQNLVGRPRRPRLLLTHH